MSSDLLKSFGITAKALKSCKEETVARLTAGLERIKPALKAKESDVGPLLLKVHTDWPKNAPDATLHLVEDHVVSGELDSPARVKAALRLVKQAGSNPLTWEELKNECGVGIVQGDKEIAAALASFLGEHAAALEEGRYPAANRLRSDFAKLLPWADGKAVSTQWEKGLLEKLGPKDSPVNVAAMQNLKKEGKKNDAAAKKKGAAANNNNNKNGKGKEEEESLGLVAGMDRFGSPADNRQKDPKLLEEHLKATGGCVVTRFPPEPNGYLHLGHALSMARVFGYAEAKNGYCLLRYDDTNPESEKQEYVDSIVNDVKWMGYKPRKVTHSSDYFDQLYAFAEQLIREDKAYVCDLGIEDMREQRRQKIESPFRTRSVEENLRLFRRMRDGYFDEGACTLRVKADMQSDNPNMRDFVAYRIKYLPHPHTGDKWCIYPSYDYTHCVIDSLENITHSICTLEFVSRNETYQWLLDALHLYKPPQLEAQRLQMTHIVLSKRKLLKLVQGGYVNGWTDARMPTLMGARRKGYAPRALHELMLGMGISRSADGVIPIERLDEAMRSYYNTRAPRAMAVETPIRVVVDNWPAGEVETLEAPDFPDDVSRGSHVLHWGRELYIDADDWRDEDSSKYYGLAPGKRVRLKYGYIVQHVSTDRDAAGAVTALHVTYEKDKSAKVKGTLTWLSKEDAVEAELRLLKQLFKSPTPGVEKTKSGEIVKKDFLLDLHPNSLNPVPNALVEKRCANAPVETVFQFERMGYFIVDPDTTKEKTVFNRTVSTKVTKVKF